MRQLTSILSNGCFPERFPLCWPVLPASYHVGVGSGSPNFLHSREEDPLHLASLLGRCPARGRGPGLSVMCQGASVVCQGASVMCQGGCHHSVGPDIHGAFHISILFVLPKSVCVW